MTEENKKKYQEIIKNIHAGGSTNLREAISKCMDVLINRK